MENFPHMTALKGQTWKRRWNERATEGQAMTDLDNNLVACFSADQDGSNKTFTGYISQQEAQKRYFNVEPQKLWLKGSVCLIEDKR